MLIEKIDPVGIDFLIQKFQKELHEQLMEKWELDVNDLISEEKN